MSRFGTSSLYYPVAASNLSLIGATFINIKSIQVLREVGCIYVYAQAPRTGLKHTHTCHYKLITGSFSCYVISQKACPNRDLLPT